MRSLSVCLRDIPLGLYVRLGRPTLESRQGFDFYPQSFSIVASIAHLEWVLDVLIGNSSLILFAPSHTFRCSCYDDPTLFEGSL